MNSMALNPFSLLLKPCWTLMRVKDAMAWNVGMVHDSFFRKYILAASHGNCRGSTRKPIERFGELAGFHQLLSIACSFMEHLRKTIVFRPLFEVAARRRGPFITKSRIDADAERYLETEDPTRGKAGSLADPREEISRIKEPPLARPYPTVSRTIAENCPVSYIGPPWLPISTRPAVERTRE